MVLKGIAALIVESGVGEDGGSQDGQSIEDHHQDKHLGLPIGIAVVLNQLKHQPLRVLHQYNLLSINEKEEFGDAENLRRMRLRIMG
jgi:hypothetical protein